MGYYANAQVSFLVHDKNDYLIPISSCLSSYFSISILTASRISSAFGTLLSFEITLSFSI